MILNANGVPFHGPELSEGPEDLSPELKAKLPGGKAPFQITEDMKNNLSWQQTEALYEEWFHRQSYLRFGYPCPDVPMHNVGPCAPCQGTGVRVDPDKTTAPCVRCNGVGLIQEMPPITWGCKHLYPQDEVHPAGMVFIPRGYYVCKKCFNLIERKKFKFSTELVLRCYKCINAESFRLFEINPELVIDLSRKIK
jgi:hypothetical protein